MSKGHGGRGRAGERTNNSVERPIRVLKFGSSVLETDTNVERAVAECYRAIRDGERVIAVVSAFGDTTNSLIGRAEAVSGGEVPHGADWAFATLQGAGETISAGMLGVALERSGIPAGVVDAHQAGLVGMPTDAAGGRLSADPVRLNTNIIRSLFEWAAVVVVPGYVLIDDEGLPLLLGRGGSDLTALFFAAELRDAGETVTTRLVKDVHGVYESDPAATEGPRPAMFKAVTHATALRVGGRSIQPRAVAMADHREMSFEVAAINARQGTVVGAASDELLPMEQAPIVRQVSTPALRIAMLGLGTVGLGVYRTLVSEPRRFEVVGVGVRDVRRHADPVAGSGVPEHLLTSDADELLSREADAVIELIGGQTLALDAMTRSLRSGRSVVTANKAVIAERWRELVEAGGDNVRERLGYSAAVGGVMPAIETVRRLADNGIVSIRGVINGTCNFMLDRMASGVCYADALAEAQRLGFAEADPTMDVDGTDTAQKLQILLREVGVDIDTIARTGIDGLDGGAVARAAKSGRPTRLVAKAILEDGGVSASVSPTELDADDPLAPVAGSWNRVVVTLGDGSEHLASGKGAGRYPTAQAVLADVYDIERSLHEAPSVPRRSVAEGGA